MDRRRFVPSTEGLEGRALLTSLFGSSTSQNDPIDTVPMTFKLKAARVDKLPGYMEQFRSGRFLPADTIAHLKDDLIAVAAKLHAPGTDVLNGFNARLRSIQPSSSLSVADAKGLNQSFGVVLTAAGATPQQVANLQNDMTQLTKVDTQSPQSVFLATNDYTVVLETVLAIDRPIRQPVPPQLAAKDGIRVNILNGVTTKSQPLLVGNYDAFATVQLVDATGAIFGGAVVKKNGPTQTNGVDNATGNYEITVDRPLAPGLYTFYVRALDQYGNVSNYSHPFHLKVNTPKQGVVTEVLIPPGGPLGLTKK
jgi:Bacterial Ig-like domain